MVNAETWQALAEYESFLGRQVDAVIYDWTIRRYRRCKIQPLRTRKDDPPPADPDEMIDEPELIEKHEPVARKPSSKPTTGRGEFDERIPAYLREYGPSHAKLIAADLGYHYESLHYHIKSKVGTVYCACGKVGKTVIWGLVGVHDATPT